MKLSHYLQCKQFQLVVVVKKTKFLLVTQSGLRRAVNSDALYYDVEG